jgi:NADP-dependent 3-hydroxy acid dehydrogenase YdfG
MQKTVFITGATSGFGWAMAHIFAQNGYDIIATGRRAERLQVLKAEIQAQYNVDFLPLCFDVRRHDAVHQAITNLPKKWQKIDILINNAGLAVGKDAVQNADIQHWEQMIDTNIKGVLYITKYILPLMIAQASGHIINISSIAGKQAYGGGSVYCATKFGVDAFTQALRADVLAHGIKVSSISPGAADTEFSLVRFGGDAQAAQAVYEGFEPLQAHDVAEAVWFMANRPASVNIADLVILPTAQASATQIYKK